MSCLISLSGFALVAAALICPVPETPPSTDYCQRLQQQIQGRKHGFLAGNVTYYIGGFHASWQPIEQETLGLTHPFHHDLRSRGVGLVRSRGEGHDNTGTGNDYSGWEFYKDTRVLYGSVIVDGKIHRYPVPTKMAWRPDRMICEYEVAGVRFREEKFIALNDVACSIITSSKPVTLRFDGQSFFGRHSVNSSATIEYDAGHNAIHIVEGGTTKCLPDTDRKERVGPIMYQGMSTVLSASRSFADSHRFTRGKQGQHKYEFDLPCDSEGAAVVWSMHNQQQQALANAMHVLGSPSPRGSWKPTLQMREKTREVNRLLNEQVPYFRCSDQKFEDIYYYLWSLYLMYDIKVGHGMETQPHTQTAVNNFLGMHRYDATFQIRVGSWTSDKRRYAFGNVLTWKELFAAGHYRKTANGVVSLADNKGTAWHSGAYGNELSEHVLGAWQVYQHSGDVQFVRDCYEGYFREVFKDAISPFFSNHFEVAEVLIAMAKLTRHEEDIERWRKLVPSEPNRIRTWFEQRWQANKHKHFFGGPRDGMLMTTGFWHLRSKHFPREYARQMVESWALDNRQGFLSDDSRPFPLAMSRQSMERFASRDDNAFGYTPDTAYFTLDGMFRQRLAEPASRLTLQHLRTYNFHPDWEIPVAPEAYRRDGRLFGDQYSNFNAGKLLLVLEGLAGLSYSVPDNRLSVRDAMPKEWQSMELRIPIRKPAMDRTHWPTIRYQRSQTGGELTKSIRVTDCPLDITIEPWVEGRRVISQKTESQEIRKSAASVILRSR